MENLETTKNAMSEQDIEDLTFERILEDYFEICISKWGDKIIVEITGKDNNDNETTVYALLNKKDSDEVLAMKHIGINNRR